jgi:aminopeptidase 2
LVAFVIGDLGYVETSTTGRHNNGNPVLIRVYAPKGRENHGEFALNVAAQVLEYFAKGLKKFSRLQYHHWCYSI